MKKMAFNANLQVSILKEGKKFIAFSPALDLSTSGKSFEEAKERFSEAAIIFFEEVVKDGVLEDVLKDLGWQKSNAKWNPPVVISQENQSVEVPVGA